MSKKLTIMVSLIVIACTINRTNVFATNNNDGYTTKTEYDGVFQSTTGEYAIALDSETIWLKVGRQDIHLGSTDEVMSFCHNPNLSKELRNYVFQLAQEKSSDEQITVFSPDLLQNDDSSSYYYEGTEMKVDRVYRSPQWTRYYSIVSGTTTKAVMAVLTNAVCFAGTSSIPGFSFSMSLLELFEDVAGSVITTSPDDYLQVRLYYDNVTQFTYAKRFGNWQLGYVSRNNLLSRLQENAQLTTSSGVKHEEPVLYLAKSLCPSDYYSPWATAYYYCMFEDTYLNIFNYTKVRNTKFQLT